MSWTFYKSNLYNNFDATATPELEAETFTDSIGGAQSASAVAPDLLDGKAGKRIEIDTSNQTTSPRVDVDLTERIDADFMAMLGHSARQSYPEVVRKIFGFTTEADAGWSDTTPVTPTFIASGFLGKGRPYTDFDGVDDVGNNDTDPVGGFPFSMECWFRTASSNAGTVMYIGDKSTDNSYFTFDVKSDGLPNLIARNTGAREATGTTAVNDGEWHHMVGLFISSTSRNLYIDGVSVATNLETATFAAGTDRVSLGVINRASPAQYFDGDIRLARLWNRELSSSEITALYNGGLVAEADKWGAKTALSSSTLVNSDYDTFSGATATAFSVTYTTSGTQNAGTVDEVAFTSTKKYAASFTLALNSGALPSVDLKDALGGSSIAGAQTAAAGANFLEFTASSTTTGVVDFQNTAATDYDITNFKIIAIGVTAEYVPDGINEDDGKWYDTSTNALDLTLTGVDYKLNPSSTEKEFTIFEFAKVNNRYHFFEINPSGITATNDAAKQMLLGEVMAGKSFTPIAPIIGGGDGGDNAGINIFTSTGGSRSSNKRHARRRSWTRTWEYITESERVEWEDFLEGSMEFPFLFTPDNDINAGNERVIHLGRVVNDWAFVEQAVDVFSLTLVIEAEI